MAEWSKAAVLKTVVRVSGPWVRILLPPFELVRGDVLTDLWNRRNGKAVRKGFLTELGNRQVRHLTA